MDWEQEYKKYEDMGCFDNHQLSTIRFSLRNGLDVSSFAKPEIDGFKMSDIATEMCCGLLGGSKFYKPVEKVITKECVDKGFDERQLYMIAVGFDAGIDLHKFINKEFDYKQMFMIFKDWHEESVYPFYARPEFDYRQMHQIFLAIHRSDADDEKCKEVLNNPEFNYKQMRMLRYGLEEWVDVTGLLNSKLTPEQMRVMLTNLGVSVPSEEILDAVDSEFDKYVERETTPSYTEESVNKEVRIVDIDKQSATDKLVNMAKF